MSWFGSASNQVTELESKIEEATSESIPNGEIDLAVALEITDIVRSKSVPPKQCMRSLKKRLTKVHHNPNLVVSTLKLVDLCVKNGGSHFIGELSSKEFMDYLVDYLLKVQYNVHDDMNASKEEVGEFILSLIQDWATLVKGNKAFDYIEKCYNDLLKEGYEFREGNNFILSDKFADSEVPPDWIDSNECMICYTPFSIVNRKHHCRSCGGIYCQTHSSKNIPLKALGIMEPVRVCDNCYEKATSKSNRKKRESRHSKSDSLTNGDDQEDADFKKALELSLKEVSIQATDRPVSKAGSSDESEEAQMKQAIEASLREYEQEKSIRETTSSASPKKENTVSDLYNFSLPFENNRNDDMSSNRIQRVDVSPHNPSPGRNEIHPSSTDLTTQEEESINIFISLMAAVNSDQAKRAAILDNNDLSDLYYKVVRLKAKVNLALRDSISRYEACLQMNNKISTITRLYDQYLQSRLTQSYGDRYASSDQVSYQDNNKSAYMSYPEGHFVTASPTNSRYDYGNVSYTDQANHANSLYGLANYSYNSKHQSTPRGVEEFQQVNYPSIDAYQSKNDQQPTDYRPSEQVFNSFSPEPVYPPPQLSKENSQEEQNGSNNASIGKLPYPPSLNFDSYYNSSGQANPDMNKHMDEMNPSQPSISDQNSPPKSNVEEEPLIEL